ncbi:hypothetical protein SAMN05446037_103614 [Anaerovirgula multivorans]|uniref:Uncharacterized protein n=1 Tax=Anaerovirgula multivorans TaxID=312168 RepID=A0A239JJF0_9FIRM|nr:hypothetical protein SAMN05446037_103614 [Anaerovirgula multivorans]
MKKVAWYHATFFMQKNAYYGVTTNYMKIIKKIHKGFNWYCNVYKKMSKP